MCGQPKDLVPLDHQVHLHGAMQATIVKKRLAEKNFMLHLLKHDKNIQSDLKITVVGIIPMLQVGYHVNNISKQ